ncbi:TrkH family potassium uptake protein [Thermococcus barophilus]|uniref:TrkH-like system potassium uptake protein n=1 Tax=Thermococcus barophilus (strain DSM 11836 / MP) TaxID=391623 RepID=F0LK83_THEBM|nr:TrkH family potassium uptake protein [Thermococcus barophilus]ADT84795.1 TrkH-like system potassium uptake protein [Thermococcus barophilus MP]
MKLKETLALLGEIMLLFSISFLAPLTVALYYKTPISPFLIPMVMSLIIGGFLRSLGAGEEIGIREAFLLVSLAWLSIAVLGALPYILAGEGSIANPLNALFESMSGFTTTGATVVVDFSIHSKAILFWRQLTQWLGGMGIVVLAIAILPRLSVGGSELMSLEAPGPQLEKLTPHIKNTARIFWGIYVGLTAMETLILITLHYIGIAPKMTPYMALVHSFTTMSTGGFSPLSQSIKAFSPAVQWIITIFMILAGANFALFWYLMRKDYRIIRNEEFRWYIFAILGLSLLTVPYLEHQFNLNFITAFRYSIFQVASIVTTTGYATMNFSRWVFPAQFILFFAMFLGGSSGSTAGSIKIVRWVTALKAIKRELSLSFHPKSLMNVKLGGIVVGERSIRSALAFIALYFIIFSVSSLFVILNGASVNLNPTDAMSAVAATLGNIGPGIGKIGPMANYLIFPPQTRALMIVLMWFGRLEIVTVLVLFTRSYWRW